MAETGSTQECHPTFRFLVQVADVGDIFFTECTLPSLEVELHTQPEGGYNGGVHVLPGPVKPGRLMLKRGVAHHQALLGWYGDVLSGQPLRAIRNVTVTLFDAMRGPVLSLAFTRAFPVKWSGPMLQAAQNQIAIETLELAYAEVALLVR